MTLTGAMRIGELGAGTWWADVRRLTLRAGVEMESV